MNPTDGLHNGVLVLYPMLHKKTLCHTEKSCRSFCSGTMIMILVRMGIGKVNAGTGFEDLSPLDIYRNL